MRHPAEQTLQNLLADLTYSEVLVLPAPPEPDGDLLAAAWRAARDDAISAYEAWLDEPTPEAALAYRAAADREEAAAAVLASRAGEPRVRGYRVRKRTSRLDGADQ